jgi:solute:Na+ symporter, SSS family
MFSGIITSLILTLLDKLNLIPFLDNFPLQNNPSMNSFPIIFAVSIIACFVGTFLTKPESDEVLIRFYRQVKPWGFWKPVLKKVKQIDPLFVANKNFKRDMFNIIVGIIWQITLMATPIFLVIREYPSLITAIIVLIITSTILKLNWWNKLESSYGEQTLELPIPLETEKPVLVTADK